MEMVEAVALFDYNGRTNKELSFRKNQIIYIYKKMNHEWWLGHLAGGHQSGFIPDGYIKLKSRFVRKRDTHVHPLMLVDSLVWYKF
jgi:SLIT-ROBO Rho GTPase activating protein